LAARSGTGTTKNARIPMAMWRTRTSDMAVMGFTVEPGRGARLCHWSRVLRA
jgi:hypothetical protein